MKARSFTTALALAAGALAITPVAAIAQDDLRTAGVTYRDLDLATQEGQEELERRIDRAAEQVCGYDEVQVGTRARTREQRQCYRDAKRQFERHFAGIIEDAQRGG